MNKPLLARAAVAASLFAVPASAADMPLAAFPVAPPPFSWTSCYLGAHLGGGWAQKQITDPVQLVQDSFLGSGTTTGVTSVTATAGGAVIGGQVGCDYQFAPTWVVGIEGAASGSTMNGSTHVGLPLGNLGDSASFTGRTDFLSSVTGRLGYAMDRVLFYAKGGVAFAGDKYTVTGGFQGTGFGFEGLDTRAGWTAGVGVAWAFSRSWSTSLEYDYYRFGSGTVLMSDANNGFSGPVDTRQSVQVVKAAVNFHVWAFDR
jgi:outer membrane immunogenic protein